MHENTTPFRLKTEIVRMLNKDARLKTQLALFNNKSVYTIQKWINENSSMLTTAENQNWIKKHLALNDSFNIIDISTGSPAIENAMADPILTGTERREKQ